MRETTPRHDDAQTSTLAKVSGHFRGFSQDIGLLATIDQGRMCYDPEVVARHGRILTPRLALQLASYTNAAELAAILRADAEPMLGSWPFPLDEVAALAKIDQAIAQTNRREALAYVFSDRATGRVAGWCSAVRWHETRDDIAMLTYWIGGEFESRGYVAEAIRAAGPHVLVWIGASRLGAGAYLSNERSRRTMQRAGLTTPDGVRQLWSSTRNRIEPIVCFAATFTDVMSWSDDTENSPLCAREELADEASHATAA